MLINREPLKGGAVKSPMIGRMRERSGACLIASQGPCVVVAVHALCTVVSQHEETKGNMDN